MKTALVLIGCVLSLGSSVPYMLDVLRDKTRPRVVSWLTWTLLTGIATAASFADHQYLSAMLTACSTIETGIIVILGLVKYGAMSFARFDIVCQVFAVVGIVLWLIFNSPVVAVAAVVIVDCIAALPTIKHAWQKPHEETFLWYLALGVAGLLTLCATTSWRLTAIAYPAYLMVLNLSIGGIVVLRLRRPRSASMTEDLAE